MTTPAQSTTSQPESPVTSGSFPIAKLDLEEEIRQMRMSPRPKGHLGKTLLRGPDMRLVLMILDRGTNIPAHRADGSLTVQTLAGRVIVTLLESSFDLSSGQVLAIERDVSHALVAIEDSAVLLTIAWTGHRLR
jgi:quercetin dioxygenase-like cupin family protein